jgi:hypothetical protein
MAKVPLMPFTLDGESARHPPAAATHRRTHRCELLREVGYSEEEIAAFEARQVGAAT